MTRTIEFPEWLQAELEKRDWRPADLSRKAGVSSGYISRVLNGERSLGVDASSAIAKALDLPAETVLRKAGLLPDRTEAHSPTSEEIEMIKLFSSLSEEDQEEILRLMWFKLERRKRITARGEKQAG